MASLIFKKEFCNTALKVLRLRKINLVFATVLLASLSATGCGTFSKKSVKAGDASNGGVAEIIRVYSDTGTGNADSNPTNRPASPIATVDVEVRGKKLKNNRFDYPVVVNPSVEKWIDYFTGRGRVHFEKYLQRSRFFVPTIARVLRENKMPQDLVYLAMIESGFNNVARSHASAVGPWQFIRATGRRYGLNINYWIDERRDTRKSTQAAIDYLRELYNEFGSWEIAAASYNAGENKLRRAIARYKTKNFWEIAKQRYLRPETKNYVPKIMAAAILAKNPELYGFEDPFSHAEPNPTLVAFDEPTPKELGNEGAVAKDAPTVPDGETAPEDAEDTEVAEDDSEDDDAPAEEGLHAIMAQDSEMTGLASSVYMVANPKEQILGFEVKGPADLFSVAKAAGIPFTALKQLNPELLRWCTPPQSKSYLIKLPASSKQSFLSNYNNNTFERKVTFAQYTVKRGDSVNYVAKKFTVTPEVIRELNRLGDRENRLRAGANIILPWPTGYKRVLASIYSQSNNGKMSNVPRYEIEVSYD